MFEFVDDTRNYSEERCDRTLRLDTTGNPHIVAGDWYIRHDGVNWHFELIAPGIQHPSLALDADGSPHISYRDGNGLRYAMRSNYCWHTETVDADTLSGWYSSITLDGAARPCVSYQLHDPGDMQLRYATRYLSGWHVEIVDTAGAAGFSSSLAIDAYGYPHISYYGDTELRYARRDGTGWHVEIADSCSWPGMPTTSLAVDRWRRPHISYLAGRYAEIRYASKQGSMWLVDLLDDSGKTGLSSSLSLDTGGHVHVVHYDGTHTDLKYGCKYGPYWLGERADTAGDVGLYGSLATDRQQRPHVVYYDLANSALKYAYRDRPFVGSEDPNGRSSAGAERLRLHPNPATSRVRVDCDLGPNPLVGVERFHLRVYDNAGYLVTALGGLPTLQGTRSAVWDLRLEDGSPAPPGTYLLSLSTDERDAHSTAKLVVIR